MKWNYTKQAKYYKFRPNYSRKAIQQLIQLTKLDKHSVVADIGAGTGNLTVLIKDYVDGVICIEPNKAMRSEGIKRTKKDNNVYWRIGTGEQIPLSDSSIDVVMFGSSFNTCDRLKALKECLRVLKPNGFFVCLWNHRDKNNKVERIVEGIIRRNVPNYSGGIRRENQLTFLSDTNFFSEIHQIKSSELHTISFNNYLNACKSVSSPFWDLNTKKGKEIFKHIMNDIKLEFPKKKPFRIKYTTKVWVGKKE